MVSLYRRRDGYWVGAFYAPTVSGGRRRIVVYGKTREQAREKLTKAQQEARAGVLVPDELWKLGPYLEYWLENFVKRNRRPATYTLYEMNIRALPESRPRELQAHRHDRRQCPAVLQPAATTRRLRTQGTGHAHCLERRAYPCRS